MFLSELQITDLKLSQEQQINSYDDLAEDNNQRNIPAKSQIMTNAPERAISLFDHIPSNRSCADAYIEPHWCACLNWKEISLNITTNFITAQKMAQSIISTINNFTSQYHNLCEILELKSVNWVMRLNPRKEMISFKKNKDADGYVADLTDNMRMKDELYQIQITTIPGNSLFEASVQYDLQTFVAKTRITQISRINKYGEQANCIYDVNPELRKFCYCKL